MEHSAFSHRLYDQRNAALRLIRKTKGFLLIPFSRVDPSGTKRLVTARSALGRNARVIVVQPLKGTDSRREKRRRKQNLFYMFDEGRYYGSSDGAALFDSDALSIRLPHLKDSLAEIDRLRASTGLRLPAWVFVTPQTIMTEEAARNDVARADAVFAKASEVRSRDSERDRTFFAMCRSQRCEPVVVTQNIGDFAGVEIDGGAAQRHALGEQIKAEFQDHHRRDAKKKRADIG